MKQTEIVTQVQTRLISGRRDKTPKDSAKSWEKYWIIKATIPEDRNKL